MKKEKVKRMVKYGAVGLFGTTFQYVGNLIGVYYLGIEYWITGISMAIISYVASFNIYDSLTQKKNSKENTNKERQTNYHSIIKMMEDNHGIKLYHSRE